MNVRNLAGVRVRKTDATARARPAAAPTEAGMALLAVLVLMLVIGGSSAAFISFMHRHQMRAGLHHRAAAALAVAEAGVHRATSLLESASSNGGGPGRAWRPGAYSESLRIGPLEGRFTVSIKDAPDGGLLITSVGEVAGVARTIRARSYLASPALLAALYGSSVVRLENPPAAAVILPYGESSMDRPWVHIAAGRGIWFATTAVSINDPSVVFDVGAGPTDAPSRPGAMLQRYRPGPVRLLLARHAELTLDRSHQAVDIQQLRVMGVFLDGVVLRKETFPTLPDFDRAYYQSRAVANITNAWINEAAGRYLGDEELARKRDSLYTQAEFERVLAYFKTGPHPARLHGIVYVTGFVTLLGGQNLEIADGGLVIEGALHLGERAILDVSHSPATRTLPGVIVLGSLGRLIVVHDAQLRVHGLVYASRSIDVIDRGRIDVVGAVLGGDPELSFRNRAATVVIRYDPAVLGTPGLRVAENEPVVAWVAEWREEP